MEQNNQMNLQEEEGERPIYPFLESQSSLEIRHLEVPNQMSSFRHQRQRTFSCDSNNEFGGEGGKYLEASHQCKLLKGLTQDPTGYLNSANRNQPYEGFSLDQINEEIPNEGEIEPFNPQSSYEPPVTRQGESLFANFPSPQIPGDPSEGAKPKFMMAKQLVREVNFRGGNKNK